MVNTLGSDSSPDCLAHGLLLPLLFCTGLKGDLCWLPFSANLSSYSKFGSGFLFITTAPKGQQGIFSVQFVSLFVN